MGQSKDTDIAAVLLGFSALDKTQRKKFVAKLNEFIYVSARKRRTLMKGWLEACQDLNHPAVNMVAEAMTAYDVHGAEPHTTGAEKDRDSGD